MDYTIMDTSTPTMLQEIPTAANILTAMTNPPKAFEDEQRIFELFHRGYYWHDSRNQEQAQQILNGAVIAYQHGFIRQFSLYKEELFNIVTKDMAVAAEAAIQQHPQSYKDFLYYYPDGYVVSIWGFTAPYLTASGSVSNSYEWKYDQLAVFPRLIPPHALEILALLEQQRLTPVSYWVADKIEKARQVSVDPVLCAQYGRWFVGIAQWD